MSDKFLEALKANDLQAVESLVRLGEDVNRRGIDGRTLLQTAVTEKVSVDILRFLLDKVDLTVRDSKGQSVVDLIFSGDFSGEFEEAFVNFVKGEILNGQPERLERMLLSGWGFWPVTLEQAKNVSEELADFISKLPELQEKICKLHRAIQENNCRDVQSILDRKKLILAADRSGLPPFHKAVLYGQTEITDWLIAEFKFALEHRDNMGRTALHYAAAIPDAGYIYSTLVSAGAKEDVKDLAGYTPQDYYSNSLLLGVVDLRQHIQELLESPLPEPKHASLVGDGIQKMYVPGQKQGCVPPPTTIDGKYVATHLGTALTLALAEIAERWPWDPIEFLGQWLYKYRDTMDYIEQQQKMLSTLNSEVAETQKEAAEKEKILQEQREIQETERIQREKEEEERRRKEQEELQRKAREADLLAQRPNLDTVAEEGEEDVMGKDKDGQTELHRLAAQQGSDLTALLTMGYNIADRDVNNKTARDIAAEKGIQENVDAIDNYVKSLIEKEKFGVLERLALDGYDQLKPVLDKQPLLSPSEEVNKFFLDILPKTQEKTELVLSLVNKGALDELKEALTESADLATVRDGCCRGLSHLAVLQQRGDLVDYLVTNYPATLNSKDTLNRTPLHYAMGLENEEIVSLLTSKGADSNAKDARQRLPSYYKDNPSEIKDALTSQVSTQGQEPQGQESQGHESQGQGTEQTQGTEQSQGQTDSIEGQTTETQGEGQTTQEGGGQVTSGGEQSTEQTLT